MVFVETLGVCGSKRGHRGKIGRKYAEMAREGGVATARGRMSGPVAGCPVRRMSGEFGRMSVLWIGDGHDELHGKKGNSGAKFGRIGGWKSRERWGKARSTRCKADPWIKSNKTSSHQQITKKNWGYFWWGFSDLGRKQQNQARKHGVGAPKT